MIFDDFLRRAELHSLETFINYGGEVITPISQKGYEERLKDARKSVDEFFKKRCTTLSDFDEITMHYDKEVEVVQNVYFEIGLILGAKIAFQIGKKMEELT